MQYCQFSAGQILKAIAAIFNFYIAYAVRTLQNFHSTALRIAVADISNYRIAERAGDPYAAFGAGIDIL